MEQLSERLDALGEAVARVAAKVPKSTDLAPLRRRFLAAATEPKAARRYRHAYVIAAAMVIGVVIAGIGLSPSQQATTFNVGDPPQPGVLGQWVAASDQRLRVRFSEGSSLDLSPGSRMRVTDTTAHGAEVLIERGSLHADIIHSGAKTRWTLRAGPYSLKVVGTTFEAAWDPETETFRLWMKEGAVIVNGPLVPQDRRVVAGEELSVSGRDGKMRLRNTQAHKAPVTGDVAPVPPAPHSAQSPANASTTAPAAPMASGSEHAKSPVLRDGGVDSPNADKNWRKLAQKGDYRQAMKVLDAQGVDGVIAQASAADLMALSNVARFAGRPAVAKRALLSLRKRHGATGYSAFLLGRIAADQLRSPGEAYQWFEAYLSEQPNGPLAEQALGRILEIQRHGSPEAARASAQRYLARYPNGAYAPLARSILAP